MLKIRATSLLLGFLLSAWSASLLAENAVLQQAQARLAEQGFQAGLPDGIWGPQTRAAVLAYQRQKKLSESGYLDRQTLDALGMTDAPEVIIRVNASSQEEWGMVAPNHCFWECQAKSGCPLDADTEWASRHLDDKDGDEYDAHTTCALHPLLGPVAVSWANRSVAQPCVLEGTTYRLRTGGWAFDKGSKITTDPYGFHRDSAWAMRCDKQAYENAGSTRIDGRPR